MGIFIFLLNTNFSAIHSNTQSQTAQTQLAINSCSCERECVCLLKTRVSMCSVSLGLLVLYERVDAKANLPFLSLRVKPTFSSRLKMNVPPSALCHFPPVSPAPSLFHRYPLYILSIFSEPSLYITHTHTHIQYPDTFFPPPGSLLPSHSLWPPPPTHSLSFWTYFIKGLLAGNTHRDLINCC